MVMDNQLQLDSQQISAVCKQLYNRIPDLLDKFGIDYIKYDKHYSFPCPVHGGDNSEGCSLFIDGKQNWVCWTNSCQDMYKKSILGFVRGVLSRKAGRLISLNEAVKFCTDFLDFNLGDVPILKESKNRQYLKLLSIFNQAKESVPLNVSRELIQKSLEIPSEYYLNRNYDANTLIKFDIGDCSNENKLMYNRAVVPVYNQNNEYLGSCGRAKFDTLKPKWINSKGFKKSHVLYGIHLAKDTIMKTGIVILVEGPGDVWRLHESGFENAVAISGANLSDQQLIELECCGCTKLIILTDNDEAGQKARQQIIKKCGRRFNYILPDIPSQYKDIGEMSKDEIVTLLEIY